MLPFSDIGETGIHKHTGKQTGIIALAPIFRGMQHGPSKNMMEKIILKTKKANKQKNASCTLILSGARQETHFSAWEDWNYSGNFFFIVQQYMLCMLLDVHLLDTHLRVFQRNIKAHSKTAKKYSQNANFQPFGCIFEIWLDFEIHTDQLFGILDL